MPPVNGGPEMGTQIWLQNQNRNPGMSWGEVEGREEGSLGETEDKPLSGGRGQWNK